VGLALISAIMYGYMTRPGRVGVADRILWNWVKRAGSEMRRGLERLLPEEPSREEDFEVPSLDVSERRRSVVVLAQEEARHFNHNYIGTEHLLLGLLREDEGVAARALTSLNVTLDDVRDKVESIVGTYREEGTGGQAPFSARSEKVLGLALREALQLGHSYIGTEHILLALVREPESTASEILLNLGVDPKKVREKVVELLTSAS
jgi:ATP-dependent Clp protease ATP-binding subunit ClpA